MMRAGANILSPITVNLKYPPGTVVDYAYNVFYQVHICLIFLKAVFLGRLPTYPSPKPTLTLTSHIGQNVGVGEG